MSKDKLVRTIDVFETKDYEKFSLLGGNRDIDMSHKRAIMKSMEKHGNRLDEDPIEVSEDFKILDGQHRFAAAKELGYPVCYQFSTRQTIQDVRIGNTNRRNWTWLDYAVSYRDEDGNENYKSFLELVDEFNYSFKTMFLYSGGDLGSVHGSNNTRAFLEGDFLLSDVEHARELLELYSEISGSVNIENKTFAEAVYKFIQSPIYTSAVITEVPKYRRELASCIYLSEYLFKLQDIARAAN